MTTTRDIAQDFLNRLANGDAANIAALFADHVDFLCAGTTDTDAEWIRPRETRADMEDMFSTMQAQFAPESRSASLTSFLVDNNVAVVTGHISQQLRANGQAFTIPFALHLTVVDGKINRYHIYEDSLTVANAVREPATSN